MQGVTEIIRYTIEHGLEDSFRQSYTEAVTYLDQSPHCLGYSLLQGEEEPQNFLLLIQWVSVQAHTEGFRKSPDFPKFFALTKPFFSAIQEMKHYATLLENGTGVDSAVTTRSLNADQS